MGHNEPLNLEMRNMYGLWPNKKIKNKKKNTPNKYTHLQVLPKLLPQT